MPKRKRLIVWIIGISLCLCSIPLLFFFQPWLFNPFMPLYKFTSIPSAQAGYPHYTLTRGNVTYVSDYEEYALSSPGNDHQIGQTTSRMRLYEISGQTDYIVLYDFMDQVAVFRDSSQPVLDLSAITITHLKLASAEVAPGMAPEKDTDDPQLIDEVLASLKRGTPAASSNTNVKKYCLYLSGGDLMGMQYCAGIYVDSAGKVYVSKDTLSKEWYPVSPLFSDWVKSP